MFPKKMTGLAVKSGFSMNVSLINDDFPFSNGPKK
jgi:hypothetical protein